MLSLCQNSSKNPRKIFLLVSYFGFCNLFILWCGHLAVPSLLQCTPVTSYSVPASLWHHRGSAIEEGCVYRGKPMVYILPSSGFCPRTMLSSEKQAMRMHVAYKERCVFQSIMSTKYVHIKSTTVYAPRRNWDSPNPFLASECSPPPRNRGEGAH